MIRCFYFGCWNQSGHYLFAPGGHEPPYADRERVVYYSESDGELLHLDGTLAPRRLGARFGGGLWWQGKSATRRERDIWGMGSGEYRQGQFLRHELDNGFTAISWWDRTQGDKRGACNSTILLEGVHTTEEMLAALTKHFPHVLENLKRAGVELVEITKESTK